MCVFFIFFVFVTLLLFNCICMLACIDLFLHFYGTLTGNTEGCPHLTLLQAVLQNFAENVSRLNSERDCILQRFNAFHAIWSNLLNATHTTLNVQQEIPQDARQNNPIKVRAPKSLVGETCSHNSPRCTG